MVPLGDHMGRRKNLPRGLWPVRTSPSGRLRSTTITLDPLTHALAGSAAARLVMARPLGRAAFLPGAVAALLPDADAAIRSTSDPLLYAEFHRHFTHALAFIPAGGTIAALPWIVARSTRPHWKAHLTAATIGYGTHGVLDAATTYGTRLLWPFSDVRVAWNWISIVDPLFTALLFTGVALAVWKRSATPVGIALVLSALYVAGGAVQRVRALDAQMRIATSRGHQPIRGDVFPAFGANIVWRSLYEADGVIVMDRIRVPWLGAPAWSGGWTTAALREAGEAHDEERRRDLARFRQFANGWMARAPGETGLIGDARYSMSDGGFVPVWGIRFTEAVSRPRVQWVDRSAQRRVDVRRLVREVFGRDESYGALPVPP